MRRWSRRTLPDGRRTSGRAGKEDVRPVLYLDVDDTVLSWADGEPAAVPSSRAFVEWALSNFEVRWLTKWCPSGQMPEDLLGDLAKMLGLEPERLACIEGCSWEESGAKVDGIMWLEHLVMGRPFFWVENREGLSDRDLAVLVATDTRHRYLECNVSEDETALERTRQRIEGYLGESSDPA